MGAFLAGLLLGAATGAAVAFAHQRRRRKELGKFVSFAAHEVNTPITAVNMTVLNLLSEVFGPLAPEQRPWVEMTREQILRLNGIVGELRDLIHLELNKELLLRVDEIPAAEAVDAALASVREGCRQAKIELAASVDPAAAPVLADPDRLGRTLSSLLFHARKFRASGPIRLDARPSGAYTAFVISFTGPQVAAEEARQSLEPFYPARAPKGMMTATGTGLGVPRALLRRQGGDLDLKVSGTSHVLTMTLPAAAPGK